MDKEHAEQSWDVEAHSSRVEALPALATRASERPIVLGLVAVLVPLYAAYGLGLYLAVKEIMRLFS
jgi:hypothetical protein